MEINFELSRPEWSGYPRKRYTHLGENFGLVDRLSESLKRASNKIFENLRIRAIGCDM